MWARTVEIMLGVWLALSPFIFRHAEGAWGLWATDFGCAAALWVISSMCFARRFRHLHVLNLLLAGWLMGFGYFAGGHPAGPGYQNQILVGLTLLLFAIIPTGADQPPADWQRYYQKKSG